MRADKRTPGQLPAAPGTMAWRPANQRVQRMLALRAMGRFISQKREYYPIKEHIGEAGCKRVVKCPGDGYRHSHDAQLRNQHALKELSLKRPEYILGGVVRILAHFGTVPLSVQDETTGTSARNSLSRR